MHFTHGGGYLLEHTGNCNTFKHIHSLPLVHRQKASYWFKISCFQDAKRKEVMFIAELNETVVIATTPKKIDAEELGRACRVFKHAK